MRQKINRWKRNCSVLKMLAFEFPVSILERKKIIKVVTKLSHDQINNHFYAKKLNQKTLFLREKIKVIA